MATAVKCFEWGQAQPPAASLLRAVNALLQVEAAAGSRRTRRIHARAWVETDSSVTQNTCLDAQTYSCTRTETTLSTLINPCVPKITKLISLFFSLIKLNILITNACKNIHCVQEPSLHQLMFQKQMVWHSDVPGSLPPPLNTPSLKCSRVTKFLWKNLCTSWAAVWVWGHKLVH